MAFDEFNNFQKTLEVVVVDIPCKMPEVAVVDKVIYPYQARSIYKMLRINEEGTTVVVCEVEVNVT